MAESIPFQASANAGFSSSANKNISLTPGEIAKSALGTAWTNLAGLVKISPTSKNESHSDQTVLANGTILTSIENSESGSIERNLFNKAAGLATKGLVDANGLPPEPFFLRGKPQLTNTMHIKPGAAADLMVAATTSARA